MLKNNACIILFAAISFLIVPSGTTWCDNLHLIDELPNGFRIYRSGEPDQDDLEQFHELRIQEIAVLSGDAQKHELKYKHLVPGLKVVYNQKQNSHEPVKASFLHWFDNWVENARVQGKIIAFRCRCGCHRTGRLAAYYQMKYQGVPYNEAMSILHDHAKWMVLHRDLQYQVKALEDYIHGRACGQEKKYCVIMDAKPQSRQDFRTRREKLDAARMNKIRQPDKERDISLENGLLFIENGKMIERIRYGYKGFIPMFGGLPTGSGFAFGTLYRNQVVPRIFGVYGFASFSFKKYQKYEAGLISGIPGPLPLRFKVNARYRYFPEEDFYGFGMESLKTNQSNYLMEDVSVRPSVACRLFHPKFKCEIYYQWLQSKTRNGKADDVPAIEDMFPEEHLPGYGHTIKYRILGYQLNLDLRDYPGNPRSGLLITFNHEHFYDYELTRYSFQKFSAEFQGYVPFYHKHRVLAFRVYCEDLNARDNDSIPFHLRSTIGGGETLRGFREYRFRDEAIVLTNIEYRFEAFIGLDMALFGDFGQAAASLDEIELSEFKYSYGIGFRFNTVQHVFLRLDVGHGDEGTRVFFKFSHVF